VPGRAELPVLPGGGDLAEHVLVQITLGVAIGHVDGVELIDDIGEHARRGHHEKGIFHVMRVGARALGVVVAVGAEGLDEGEDLGLHRLKHLLGSSLFEPRPAKLSGGEFRLRGGVRALGKDRIFDRLAGAGGLALFKRLELVEPFDKQQVGELFDDRQRVGDAPGPHGVPDAVDFGFEFAGNHCVLTVKDFPALLQLGVGTGRLILQILPAGLGRNPEDVDRPVLVGVFGIGTTLSVGIKLSVLLFECIGDVFK
jgi:hypothetical protein